MFVADGDRVILINTEEPNLKEYIGTEWEVKSVLYAYHPASAIIKRENLEASCYIKYLEVVPPPTCPFRHGELVSIRNVPKKLKKRLGALYPAPAVLIGKTGRIHGYDLRSDCLLVKCLSGEAAWFPPCSLIPLNFKGEKFYYPYEKIKYKNKIKLITQIKKSKFNWGQLLLIDGEWVPSTDVEAIV